GHGDLDVGPVDEVRDFQPDAAAGGDVDDAGADQVHAAAVVHRRVHAQAPVTHPVAVDLLVQGEAGLHLPPGRDALHAQRQPDLDDCTLPGERQAVLSVAEPD